MEYVVPQNAPAAILVVFICVQDNVPSDDLEARQAVQTMHGGMRLRLPPYMLPSHFIMMDSMPLMATGKLDRRRVRGIAESMRLSDIGLLEDLGPTQGGQVETEKEKQLQGLWADVLGTKDAENIGRDDSFIQLGGDSLSAIKLSAAARRKEGVMLEVPDVLCGLRSMGRVRGLSLRCRHSIHRHVCAARRPMASHCLSRQPHSRLAVISA